MYREEVANTCRLCGTAATTRGLCNAHYQILRRKGELAIHRPQSALDKYLRKVLHNIHSRCTYPKMHSFEHYGGKGIQNHLSLDDLRSLWIRDEAEKMIRPSIDRINASEHYILDNCRFLELSENVKRANRKPCRACGAQEPRKTKGLCAPCRQVERKAQRRCKLCAGELEKGLTVAICATCRIVESRCLQCGTSVKRDQVRQASYIRNQKTFCDRHCFGKWLGVNHGKGRSKGLVG